MLSLDVIVKFEEDIGEAGNNVVLVIFILFFHSPLIFLMYTVKLGHVRPKKVVLFLEIGRAKFFYQLPARVSRMCMRISIFCLKKKQTPIKKTSPSKLFVRIYVFFPSNNKRALSFSTKLE